MAAVIALTIEHDFIRWLTEHQDNCTDKPHVRMGPGDDAAIVDLQEGLTVITTDMIGDGSHFLLYSHSLESIGRKALAVNLSDLAAMAARPTSAVISMMLPRTMPIDDVQKIYGGVKALADQFQVPIVGGDTNTWDGRLTIGCTVTGTIPVDRDENVFRLGAAVPGDVVMISGSLGNSITGKHLSFEPRIDLAQHLVDRYTIHAATDVTDSLTIDMAAIMLKSSVGVRLDILKLPVSDTASDLDAADFNADSENEMPQFASSINAALFDGEDFELLVTTDEETASKILEDPQCPAPMTVIGTITDTGKFEVIDDGGKTIELKPKGFVH